MLQKITFAFVLISNLVTAQVSIDWYNYPGGAAVASNSSYDVYTVNWDSNPGGDITLTKRDSSGAILWETFFDNTDLTRHEVSTWVETDQLENIIVSGTIRSGFSNPVNASSVVMKFDSSGTLIWRVIYESTFDGSSTRKVLVDADNYIYVLGLGTGSNGIVTKIKKFDPAGVPVWSYFDTVGIGFPLNFKFTPDSNLLIIARSQTGILNGFSKIDLNGNLIWSKAGIGSQSIGDAAGDSLGNTFIVNGENVFSNPGSILQKVSPAGLVIWTDTCSITAFRVEVGNDDNPVISGFPNSGTPGAAFIKYDSNGNIVWQNLDADGPGYALLLHAQMKMDSDNAAYLAAGTLTEMALCKVNSDGTSAWTAVIPGSYANAFDFYTSNIIYVTGGTTAKLGQWVSTGNSNLLNIDHSPDVEIYPNPCIGNATIKFNLFVVSTFSISILDIAGRTIKTINGDVKLEGPQLVEVNLSELDNGVYFCRIYSNQKLQVIKFIKT